MKITFSSHGSSRVADIITVVVFGCITLPFAPIVLFMLVGMWATGDVVGISAMMLMCGAFVILPLVIMIITIRRIVKNQYAASDLSGEPVVMESEQVPHVVPVPVKHAEMGDVAPADYLCKHGDTQGETVTFCRNCGAAISSTMTECPDCKTRLR